MTNDARGIQPLCSVTGSLYKVQSLSKNMRSLKIRVTCNARADEGTIKRVHKYLTSGIAYPNSLPRTFFTDQREQSKTTNTETVLPQAT